MRIIRRAPHRREPRTPQQPAPQQLASPQPASLRRRAAASVINTAVGLSGLATTVGVGALVLDCVDKLGYDGEPFRRMAADPQRITARLQSRPVKLALHVLTLATPLRRIKRRSLGYAMLGLRLVDARSGGAPTRRQAFVRATAKRLWPVLCKQLLPTPKTPPLEQDRLPAELMAVKVRFPDDPDARNHALMQVYKDRQVDPRRSCMPLLARLPLLAAIDLPVFSRLRQSLPDRLAGTTVVRDPQSLLKNTFARATP